MLGSAQTAGRSGRGRSSKAAAGVARFLNQCAQRIGAADERRCTGGCVLLKGISVAFLGLALYYARFFVLRQEATTLLQLVALLCAAGWLLLGGADRSSGRSGAWFIGWRPVSWQGWTLLGGVLGVAVVVFVVLDRDAHSASDTLNRIAPTYALLLALVLRAHAEHATFSRNVDRDATN